MSFFLSQLSLTDISGRGALYWGVCGLNLGVQTYQSTIINQQTPTRGSDGYVSRGTSASDSDSTGFIYCAVPPGLRATDTLIPPTSILYGSMTSGLYISYIEVGGIRVSAAKGR